MDRVQLRRIARILWPFASLWLLLAIAVALFSGLEIRSDRSSALAAARAETESFARAARAHVAETLDQHDHVLTLQKIVHERRLAPSPLAAFAEAGSADGRPRRVDQYDGDGRLVATSGTSAAPPPTIADRGWFDDARSHPGPGLRVGKPFPGSAPGSFFVPLTKRLETPDGEFDGVLATLVDPAQVLGALGALSSNDQISLGIVDRQGFVYARTRGGATGRAERALAAGAAVPGTDVSAQDAVLDGQASFVARAGWPGRDLAVFAAMSEDAALARHRRHARTTLVFALVTLSAMTLALLLVGRRAFAERDRRRQLERRYEEVRNRARTDPLTSVLNRAAFDEHLRVAHAILAADGRPFVLAFIDIDRFKALNDRFGHAVGDRALKRVGHLLREGVRADDTVARLGGDEFAVLMPGGNALAMRRVFEPLRGRLARFVADEKWPISFSIGVVAFESAPSRPRDAIGLADRVMYDVKSHGRDGVRYAIYREGRLQQDHEPEKAAA